METLATRNALWAAIRSKAEYDVGRKPVEVWIFMSTESNTLVPVPKNFGSVAVWLTRQAG
jgi:hypothetical protein